MDEAPEEVDRYVGGGAAGHTEQAALGRTRLEGQRWMMNHDAEAHRHFQSLNIDEKMEEVWFGMRELRALGIEMLQRQDKTNGHVQHTKEELAAHLEAHEKEETEIAFLKRWGGRGTAIIIAAIAVAGTLAGIAERVW